jgi:hypothetical protein
MNKLIRLHGLSRNPSFVCSVRGQGRDGPWINYPSKGTSGHDKEIVRPGHVNRQQHARCCDTPPRGIGDLTAQCVPTPDRDYPASRLDIFVRLIAVAGFGKISLLVGSAANG